MKLFKVEMGRKNCSVEKVIAGHYYVIADRLAQAETKALCGAWVEGHKDLIVVRTTLLAADAGGGLLG